MDAVNFSQATFAGQLAARIVAMDGLALPPEAIYWSKIGLLDTVGVTLAGAREGCARILGEVLASQGSCVVIGTDTRANALDAALINGTAAHALDYDNATNTMFGHASATMMPALLAAAEAYGGCGRDVLVAHIAGFEAGARIGRAVNLHHYEIGWHPTSTLGVFAVAAACAKLLKLDVAQTTTALALATSLASGLKANFGTMTKPLHSGHCARAGLQAALLARKGFTANERTFEHKQGFFNLFNGAGNYDAARALESWGEPLDIVNPGACYKQYPCCASTHAPVDAALQLRAQHRFELGDITRIDTFTAARRLAHTNRPDPQTPLDAKFSVQYCVARALVSGGAVFEHFEGDALADASVRALLGKVHSSPHAPGQLPGDNTAGAEVRITLRDGRVLAAKVERALGRTALNAIPEAGMRDKFRSCARRVLDDSVIEPLLKAVDDFEHAPSVLPFMAMLITPRGGYREDRNAARRGF
jgi:2-methylcitrate dehydratase PrpD